MDATWMPAPRHFAFITLIPKLTSVVAHRNTQLPPSSQTTSGAHRLDLDSNRGLIGIIAWIFVTIVYLTAVDLDVSSGIFANLPACRQLNLISRLGPKIPLISIRN